MTRGGGGSPGADEREGAAQGLPQLLAEDVEGAPLLRPAPTPPRRHSLLSAATCMNPCQSRQHSSQATTCVGKAAMESWNVGVRVLNLKGSVGCGYSGVLCLPDRTGGTPPGPPDCASQIASQQDSAYSHTSELNICSDTNG